jgi:hypothetical protein
MHTDLHIKCTYTHMHTNTTHTHACTHTRTHTHIPLVSTAAFLASKKATTSSSLRFRLFTNTCTKAGNSMYWRRCSLQIGREACKSHQRLSLQIGQNRVFRVGQAHIFKQCVYGTFGSKITKYTVIYDAYIWF